MKNEKIDINTDILKLAFQQKRDQILKDFFTFLQFQTVSSEPVYSTHMHDCAKWLIKYLSDMGFDAEQWDGEGYPVVFASNMKAGPDKPTILIYNHYDVQPTDPINAWFSPPFEPTIRSGQVFARGAQDNKGQCFYVLQALKFLSEQGDSLPVNVKLIIEGEEESGSACIASLLKKKQKELKADYLAIVDLGIPGPNKPAITLGIRGLLAMDIEVCGAKTDLHSGTNGGLVFNPIHALVEILSKIRLANGKIAIPGFYDDIQKLSEKDLSLISFDFNEEEYVEKFGVKATGGEKEFLPLQRAWIRPTLEINGIEGGYTGQGFKTVIPSRAYAKLSCRLVPGQDPQKIGNLVSNFLIKQAPDGVTVKVNILPGAGKSVRSNPTSPVARAFGQAYQEIFNTPCTFILEGASIPIVAKLQEAAQSELVLIGLGLADDQIHAPNEHFGLDRLEKGFLIVSRALQLLGTNN